jgi:DNA polymerase III epsilon subunit family exonuclease
LDGVELATYQTLIHPDLPIPPDVQRVHGISDTMVRGQPSIEQVLPQFIEFLGHPDTILLVHNASFDLGFLAMALMRLGIAFPPHCLFDTLGLARRLFPRWPSHSLENVATVLSVANRTGHRALPDARLVKDVFRAMLRCRPSIKTMADLVRLSTPLTFADAPVYTIQPPAGFEALAMALAGRCAMMIVYEKGMQRSRPRKITPRSLVEVQGIAYVIAHCHKDDVEKTFRLDRIRQCWLEIY